MRRRNLPIRGIVSSHPKRLDQLSSELEASNLEQPIVFNEETPESSNVETPHHTIDAMQPPLPTPRRRSGSRSGSQRRASKKPRKNRGGWKRTTGLKWSEVKEIHDINHAASTAGMPLNRFVSIRPPSHITDDALCKKVCYRLVSHLAQRLRRRGVPFIAIRVFEKGIGGLLHVHLLLHVPLHLLKESKGWADGIVTDIRPSASKHLGYITKQRHPLPPEVEEAVSHRRKKGEPFRGRRWSVTPDLKALLPERDA